MDVETLADQCIERITARTYLYDFQKDLIRGEIVQSLIHQSDFR